MKSDYQHLIDDFKQVLYKFRIGLLLCDLIKGGIILSSSFFVFLFLYYLISSFFQLTILFKTVYYYCFLIFLGIELLYFLVYPLFLFFLSGSYKNDLIINRLRCRLLIKTDIFVSVYNLAFHEDIIQGDRYLKEAAFIQKYQYLKEQNLLYISSRRYLYKGIPVLALLLLSGALNFKNLSRQYADMKDYETVHTLLSEIKFQIQNNDLNVEYGKNFNLILKVIHENQDVENVFICYSGGEFLMSKKDSLFTYNFDVVNNDISFSFKASDQFSDLYKIKVLPSPVITDYKVTYLPPSYAGLKTEILRNTVDFRALYGSSLKFELNFAELDSLYLSCGNRTSVISLKENTQTDFMINVRESGEYNLLGSNDFFSKKNLLSFTLTCIPDLYPGIQVMEIQDSLRNSIHYFYGMVTDDYGFSALRFNYSINGNSNTVVPIHIVKNSNSQEFYFSFDFAEFAGMDQSNIKYYFEIFDNDNLSGPKSTRSQDQNYRVPDLNTIFDYNIETGKTVNSSLNAAEKLAKEIVTGVKELQKKMLDNTVDNWEKQQLSKDIVEKKNKLDKILDNVKQNNLKKSDLNKSFTGQDSSLIAKQKQIQDLLDKVMDDEMKNLMNEFSKLSEDFSKQKFQELDDKMKLTFDQMSEELDRNIELLKRFQIEEKHDLITKQLEKLRSDQDKFERDFNNKALSSDSLSDKSKEIKKNAENIRKNYEDLLKENQDLSEPYSLNEMKSEFQKLTQEVSKQQQNSLEGKKDKKLSDDIKKDIQKLSEDFKKQQDKNFVNKTLPDNDIELIIQNILIISLSQEELLKEFPRVEVQSLKYNELGSLQDLKRQEYKIVKDSLSILAKSNLMLASLLSHKFYDIEIKFGLLSGYIQDNKRSELAREQQYIISYLNDMALSLTDALQKNKQKSSSSDSDGQKEKGKKPGDGSEGSGKNNQEGYGKMKKFQNSLKQQLENLISQMKKGEKGKPLQQEVGKLIRENELFKKSLEDFFKETGSLSNSEKQILNEINRLLEDNIRDLANYSVSNHLINRNNQIYNKLLIAEKASKEREEFEEKRKSESAAETVYKHPDAFFNVQKKFGLIKTDFQKSDLKLNDYFKMMYNNYYIKLGNE